MKKFLVVLMAAMMVFSLAAVSMAATIDGDFRYDMYQDETKGDDDNSYATTDLRLKVAGNLSDSLSATGVFQLKHDGAKANATSWDMNEYFVTYKESWGSVKAGYYEYKFTPSRALLKSGQKHVWDKVDVLIATTINIPVVNGLTADVLFQPYAQKVQDDGAYGLSIAYAADSWGARVSYADFKMGDAKVANADDADLMAIDVYYNINEDMTVFVNAVDYASNDKDNTAVADSVYAKNGIDGIDPVVGFKWSNIAGTKLSATAEYAINPRFEDTDAEFNEYALGLKYKFTNNTGLEIEHNFAADDTNKTLARLRYQF